MQQDIVTNSYLNSIKEWIYLTQRKHAACTKYISKQDYKRVHILTTCKEYCLQYLTQLIVSWTARVLLYLRIWHNTNNLRHTLSNSKQQGSDLQFFKLLYHCNKWLDMDQTELYYLCCMASNLAKNTNCIFDSLMTILIASMLLSLIVFRRIPITCFNKLEY